MMANKATAMRIRVTPETIRVLFAAVLLFTTVRGQDSTVNTPSTPLTAEQSSPAIEQSASVGEQNTPAIEQSAPVGEQNTPVVEQSTSVAVRSTPVAEQGTSVAIDSTPVAEQSTSVAVESIPVAEQSTSVAVESTSGVEQGTPVVDQSSLAVEQSTQGVIQSTSVAVESSTSFSTSSALQSSQDTTLRLDDTWTLVVSMTAPVISSSDSFLVSTGVSDVEISSFTNSTTIVTSPSHDATSSIVSFSAVPSPTPPLTSYEISLDIASSELLTTLTVTSTIIPSPSSTEMMAPSSSDLDSLKSENQRLSDEVADLDSKVTGLTIAVAVLAVLLVLVIAGIVIYKVLMYRRSQKPDTAQVEEMERERKVDLRPNYFRPQTVYNVADMELSSATPDLRSQHNLKSFKNEAYTDTEGQGGQGETKNDVGNSNEYDNAKVSQRDGGDELQRSHESDVVRESFVEVDLDQPA